MTRILDRYIIEELGPPFAIGVGVFTFFLVIDRIYQLTDLVMALFAGPLSCVGGSLAIYDPDQDPERAGAAQIVAFVRNVLVRPTISP